MENLGRYLNEPQPDASKSSTISVTNSNFTTPLSIASTSRLMSSQKQQQLDAQLALQRRRRRQNLNNLLNLKSSSVTSMVNEEFVDDWSKESCSDLMQATEKFLVGQRRREKSSLRRCKETIKTRTDVNDKQFTEDRLREFDSKICLDFLMKKHHRTFNNLTSVETQSTGAFKNYRMLIADENANRNLHCARCIIKNRRYEENILNEAASSFLDPNQARKKKLLQQESFRYGQSLNQPQLMTNSKVSKLPRIHTFQTRQPTTIPEQPSESLMTVDTLPQSNTPTVTTSKVKSNDFDSSSFLAYKNHATATLRKMPIEVRKRTMLTENSST